MPRALVVTTVSASLIALAAVGMAEARSPVNSISIKEPMPQQEQVFLDHDMRRGGFGMPVVEPFAMQDAPVGAGTPPASTAVPLSLQGSAIVAHRGGALVVDADSGMLVRTDGDGVKLAELKIGPGVSQLVVDRASERAYVADRAGDRIIIVDVAGQQLRKADSFSTAAEPFGVALTPDGSTLLVTTVADHSLAAFDVATGMSRWEMELGTEPRGVAIAPQGHEAMVTFLTTGAVARVDISRDTPRMSFVSIDPTATASLANDPSAAQDPFSDEGKSFSRSAFAVGYVGNGVAVVPHQLSTPHLATGDFESESSGYGGGNGFTAPITHRLAFLATPDAGEQGAVRTAMASTNLHQPRALAYDGRTDTLFVAGYGSDDIVAVADVSQASVHLGWQYKIPPSEGACGPTGLSVDPDDGHVLAFCSLTRKVVRLSKDATTAQAPVVVAMSDSLTESRLSAEAQRGRELFRRGNASEISSFGAMACASCHPEVRADGLSWRLQGKNLQTPFLAGRIAGAHPFKWDGKDPNIQASLINTVQRLGGVGISPTQATEMAAFLESVDPPRAPSVDDPKAVARGKALFESETTGCLTCHNGPLLTDQNQYDLDTDLEEADTPSLIGLASSAPYYHDGSARTLEALLRGNASIHGMGQISPLDDAQISDLVQYLETL